MKNQKKSFFSVAIFKKVKEVVFGTAFSYFLKKKEFLVSLFLKILKGKKRRFWCGFF
jgi:hypothetical protein